MNHRIRLPLAALAALTFVWSLGALPAAARDFVVDKAGMFSAATVSALDSRIGAFNAQTGKDIVVETVPSLAGASIGDAARAAFSEQNVNGVLIFIARDERRDIIVSDAAGARAGWFAPEILRSVRSSMEAQFRSENYDAGVTAAVDGILNVYRAHVGSSRNPSSNAAGAPMTSPAQSAFGGFHLSMFWWIVIIVVGFLVLRAILRAISAPRYGPGAMPPGAPGGMPPGGYGPGYGYGGGGFGGGGSFFSGLLGGLGGAWLGNEMFGQHGGIGGGGIAPADASQAANPADAGGWQNDAGQADMGGASGGDWSGGGFGGGDFGGGGGGDFGGGGGDAGGGW